MAVPAPNSPSARPSRTPPPPLDAAALDRLALRYVEKFATSTGKLTDYLKRKLRERGWAGEGAPDPAAVAARMAGLGYVDDRGFAEAKGAALGRRGMGVRRVAQALRAAGIAEEDASGVLDDARDDAFARALTLARRKRIGPFAAVRADEKLRARHFGQLLRAGHDPALARRLVDAAPGEIPPAP